MTTSDPIAGAGTHKCEKCGRPFTPLDQRPSHLLRNPPRFCSRACGTGWRAAKVEVQCVQCGKTMLRRLGHAAAAVERGPFCSQTCYGKWARKNLRGSKNPNWLTGTRVGTRAWERARQAARLRDGDRCQDCQSGNIGINLSSPAGGTLRLGPAPLVVHHIVPWAPGDPDPHNLENLVTLCRTCHRRRHAALERG